MGNASHDLPTELAAVFRRYPAARLKFDAYSASHQNEYITYITEAKKPETRIRRADKVIMMITGKKLATVYEPKTIPEVFGIKPGMVCIAINQPDDYQQIMGGWQPAKAVSTARIDLAHLFVRSQGELTNELPKLITRLQPAGMVWVSWLKKSSGIATDVTENTIRDYALSLGLVDVKVCAVSDDWSGLKLVIRRENRLY
jgi:hypothetical protein